MAKELTEIMIDGFNAERAQGWAGHVGKMNEVARAAITETKGDSDE